MQIQYGGATTEDIVLAQQPPQENANPRTAPPQEVKPKKSSQLSRRRGESKQSKKASLVVNLSKGKPPSSLQKRQSGPKGRNSHHNRTFQPQTQSL